MIKYSTWRNEIEAVEVISETEKTVTLSGSNRRRNKVSEYENFHNTWEEARDFLRDKQNAKVEIAERNILIAREEIARLSAMEPPQ